MKLENNLRKLNLGESYEMLNGCSYTKVIGGWVFANGSKSSMVFIPDTKEAEKSKNIMEDKFFESAKKRIADVWIEKTYDNMFIENCAKQDFVFSIEELKELAKNAYIAGMSLSF